MGEPTRDYTQFIRDCRLATTNGYRDTPTVTDTDTGSVVALPNRGTPTRTLYVHLPWHQVQILMEARVSPTALYLYLCVWRQCALRKSLTIALTATTLAGLTFSRYQKTRALGALERAGLLRVERHRGLNPLVTLTVDTPPWTR